MHTKIPFKYAMKLESKGLKAASFGEEDGIYPFLSSGQKIKSCNSFDHDGEYIVIGDGGIFNSRYINGKFSASDHTLLYAPLNNVYARFVSYYLEANKDELDILTFKGMGMRNINREALNRIEIPLPDLATQQRIAVFLDARTAKIDALSSELTAFKANLLLQKRSLVSECVTKGIPSERDRAYKDSGVEWLGEIPAGWEIRRAKSFVKSLNGGIWGFEKGEDEFDVRCLRVADFDRSNNKTQANNSTIRSYKNSQVKDKMLKNGNLIIEKSGGGEQSPVGNVVLYDLDEPAMYSNFVARIQLKEDIKPIFALYIFQTMYNQKINTRSIRQTTGIQNLNTNSYLSEKVSLPPIDEQQRIADYLDIECARIDALIGEIDNQVNLLKTYRKSLINEVVTGKLEV